MDYYVCSRCGKIIDEFEMDFKSVQGNNEVFCEVCASVIDNLGETFYRSMTCMKCGKILKECLCLDLKYRLEKLYINFKREEKL